MLRSGVDILEINRLASMKRDQPEIYQRFISRVFTENEIREANGRISYFAGRFTAKEAASKALCCGIGHLGWRSIEILYGLQGEPILHFYQKAASLIEECHISEWSVSISHTDTMAIAFVIMQ